MLIQKSSDYKVLLQASKQAHTRSLDLNNNIAQACEFSVIQK